MPGTIKLVPRSIWKRMKRGTYGKIGRYRKFSHYYFNTSDWKAQIEIWRNLLKEQFDNYYIQVEPRISLMELNKPKLLTFKNKMYAPEKVKPQKEKTSS